MHEEEDDGAILEWQFARGRRRGGGADGKQIAKRQSAERQAADAQELPAPPAAGILELILQRQHDDKVVGRVLLRPELRDERK